jgi:peptidoglycan/LPS O-acetylase OafA/YrhL
MAFGMKTKVGRLLAVLFLASFAINIVLSITNITDDFYLPVSRFWELLAGASLAWWRPIYLTSNARSWISIAGLAALLASVALFTPELRFPGWLALLPVAGAVAVILAGRNAVVNRIVFSNRVVVFVGLISYPIYLWHWPLISYASIIRLGKPPTPLMALGLVAASFVLAWATYRFIEYPIRFGGAPLPSHADRRCINSHAWSVRARRLGQERFPRTFPALARYRRQEDRRRQTRCGLQVYQGHGGNRARLDLSDASGPRRAEGSVKRRQYAVSLRP